jgi:hypothetical protein
MCPIFVVCSLIEMIVVFMYYHAQLAKLGKIMMYLIVH